MYSCEFQYFMDFQLVMFSVKFFCCIFLIIQFTNCSNLVERSCNDFKNNADLLCNDLNGFPILINGKDFKDPNRIEFIWIDRKLDIKCKQDNPMRKKFHFYFHNIDEIVISKCLTTENMFNIFPNLIESNVTSITLNCLDCSLSNLFSNFPSLKILDIRTPYFKGRNQTISLTDLPNLHSHKIHSTGKYHK